MAKKNEAPLTETDALKSENAELRTQLERKGTDPETAAKLAVLETVVVEKDERISDLELAVARLSKDSEKIRKGPVDMPSPLKIGKDVFRFAIPAVIYKGKRITAQDVADDKELALQLIAEGSGMLVKV